MWRQVGWGSYGPRSPCVHLHDSPQACVHLHDSPHVPFLSCSIFHCPHHPSPSLERENHTDRKLRETRTGRAGTKGAPEMITEVPCGSQAGETEACSRPWSPDPYKLVTTHLISSRGRPDALQTPQLLAPPAASFLV